MGIAGSTLDLIRTVFSRDNALPTPSLHFDDITKAFLSYGGSAIGPQSDFNKYLAGNVQLDQDLMGRYADYEDMDSYPELGCIIGESLVSTPNGEFRIDELCKMYPNGEKFKVFAYDVKKHEFVIANAHSPRKTKTDKVVKIIFDSGDILECTADHKIMTRNEKWVEAGSLKSGQSVMPLIMHKTAKGYFRVNSPVLGQNARKYVHTMVAEAKYGDIDPSKYDVHHKDRVKTNNDWDNIVLMDSGEHTRLHVKDFKFNPAKGWSDKRRLELVNRKRTSDLQWADKEKDSLKTERVFKPRKSSTRIDFEKLLHEVRTSITIQEAARRLGMSWNTVCRHMIRNGFNYRTEVATNIENHKVVEVIESGVCDVYDLTTEVYHNFVANGIVVHNSAIDMYADDATQQDVMTGKSIWFDAHDKTIEKILNEMLHTNLRVEEDLWEIARSMCKMGNNFEEIIVLDKLGVQKLNHLPPATVRRIEDRNGILYGFMQDNGMTFRVDTQTFMSKLAQKGMVSVKDDPSSDSINVYEPWEVVHFRLRGKSRKELYGTSIVESARWVWKRLSLLEDAMILYKITRSPQRYAFYIDVGDIPPRQVKAEINRVKNDFKKTKYIDPATGKLSFRYNPLCLSLDTRIPVLSGSTKTLRELIKDHEFGVKNYTYSLDRESKMIVPGEISWAGITRKDAELVKVTIDNCRQEIVTPDHKFILRSGEYKEAKDLKPGDSLMPFNRGINGKYEYIVHPGEAGWDSIEQTHRLVGRSFYGDIADFQIHHKDEKKRNNNPDNLHPMTESEHAKLHNMFGTWNKTDAHSQQVSENNRKYEKWRNIVAYNNSEQHELDNEIRRVAVSKYRKDAGEEHNKKLRLKFSESVKDVLIDLVRSMPDASIDAICEKIQERSEYLEKFQEGNSRNVISIHRHLVLKALRSFGYENYTEFKKNVLNNHKVIDIEFLTYKEDTGCITVDKWHNFALESGVFVKNSADEDLFIPVRKGKRTSEVEVLSGPEGQQVDDVNYFKDKLFTALKIPRSYLGMDETVGRANLASQDIRYARTVLRVQRELKNGYHQIARVDLSARNIDPDRVSFDCHMVIPSGAMELAQMEVQNAKLDLGGRYRDAQFSEYFVWSTILGMADDEIIKIREQRMNERQAESGSGYESDSSKWADQERDKLDPALKKYTSQIIGEIQEGKTEFGRRMKMLRGLMTEMKHALGQSTKQILNRKGH